MIGLIIGAAVLGIIIAVMEQDEFPGWGQMIIGVLAAAVPAFVVNMFSPPSMFFVGLAVGAVCAGVAISALCGMTLKRASVAAAIYLVIQTGVSFALQWMLH